MPFQHLFRDPVLVVLLAASLASWAIILDCALTLRRSMRADAAHIGGKSTHDSPLARLHCDFARNEGFSRDHILTIMDTAITLERYKLERLLPTLGAIGSTAPYVGLLGTVIGIIQAFQSIQAQNNMSPSVVAGGIATALIATAAGLSVAIPSVVAHHLFSAAISARVAGWESTVAQWLPRGSSKEVGHEPVARS